jgi:hypothetical protein
VNQPEMEGRIGMMFRSYSRCRAVVGAPRNAHEAASECYRYAPTKSGLGPREPQETQGGSCRQRALLKKTPRRRQGCVRLQPLDPRTARECCHNNFTLLVRKETQLARSEMSEKIGDLALGIGLLVGGAVLLIPALVVLLQSAVTALVDAKIPLVWSALIVGGATLLIGLVLLAIGVSRLKAARPVPTRTIAQLEQDAEIAKHQVRHDYGTTERAA